MMKKPQLGREDNVITVKFPWYKIIHVYSDRLRLTILQLTTINVRINYRVMTKILFP